MAKPYFLTRQTANLMEDFARELAAGSSMYLLYGEPRVGKTRLLEELRANRLGDESVHWIDLANAPEDITSPDLSNEIEQLFDQAAMGDVIIADHFELALKKTRHQLFLSWSTDGVDKGLNVIVASNLDGFNELRQLSQQYQVRVQSFQLMPLDEEETEAFLGHYLFPDHPLGKLKMPAPLRRQLGDARGVIGSLIEIADHDGSHIETAPLADSETLRSGSRVIIAVLLLFAIAVGVGWYFFVEPEPSLVEIPLAPAPAPAANGDTGLAEAMEAAEQDSTAAEVEPGDDEPAASSDPVAADNVETPRSADTPAVDAASIETADAAPAAIEPEAAFDAPDSSASQESSDEATSDDAGEPAAQTAAVVAESALPPDSDSPEPAANGDQGDSGIAAEPVNVSPIVDQTIDASATARAVEPDTALAVDAPAESTALASLEPAAAAEAAPRDRLLRDLKRSLDWMYARDENRGTIQVLLLSFEGFDPAGYFDYVDDLGRRQVDTDQLRIVKTFTGGKTVYSVFFGDYESRRAALRAIDELPDALRQSGPIPRSLGGIWQEIRRLPDEN